MSKPSYRSYIIAEAENGWTVEIPQHCHGHEDDDDFEPQCHVDRYVATTIEDALTIVNKAAGASPHNIAH